LAYHAAKGPANLPKLSPEKLKSYGFNEAVTAAITYFGNYGTSIKYEGVR